MNERTQKYLFFGLFLVIGILALQVPLTHLAGSKASFTVFDAFAPIAGAFLGTIPGALAVLLMQVVNFIWHGAHASDVGTFIRLLPAVVAAAYFSRKMPLNIIIPVFAIISFIANPVGREVWYFSLFWAIPIACYFYQERFLLARSLGATMTAHALGGALWIWLVPLPAAVWIGLIPVVIVERLIFTLGISAAYVAVNTFFAYLNKKQSLYVFPVQQKHVLA